MKETESIQTVDTNIKIPFWKAACFGLGDFGNNFVWTFVGSYLMISIQMYLGSQWRLSPC